MDYFFLLHRDPSVGPFPVTVWLWIKFCVHGGSGTLDFVLRDLMVVCCIWALSAFATFRTLKSRSLVTHADASVLYLRLECFCHISCIQNQVPHDSKVCDFLLVLTFNQLSKIFHTNCMCEQGPRDLVDYPLSWVLKILQITLARLLLCWSRSFRLWECFLQFPFLFISLFVFSLLCSGYF